MAPENEYRFVAYVEALSAALGHADRRGPFKDYCLGLLMQVESKSVEPLAAITAPSRTAIQHQSLLHFVAQGSWSERNRGLDHRRHRLSEEGKHLVGVTRPPTFRVPTDRKRRQR